MASPESDHSFRGVFSELERLVEVWKNLGHSYMNFEPITDLITQKLVKDIGRSVDIRNTIVELNICSTQNYGEHWETLDVFLKKMIANKNDFADPPVDPECKSDLDCLEVLEEWATLGSRMTKYSGTFPESSNLLDHMIAMKRNDLWKAFEKGIVVTDDVNSMKALEIAARLRDTLCPQFHMWMDKIIAQKLRILSIHQAGKSDPSLNGIVQSVQKPSAMPEEQNDVHQDFNKKDSGLSYGESEAVVSNVETGNLELNEDDFNTIAWVHDHSRDSSHHPSPNLDWRALDGPTASLTPRVTGENELKQAKETSDRFIQELEAENRDLVLHIQNVEADFRKYQIRYANLGFGESGLEVGMSDVKEDCAKIKGELRPMTEAFEDRKAHAIGLRNDVVKERLPHFTKDVKINELKEEKESLTKQLQNLENMVHHTKRWLSDLPDEVLKIVETEAP